MARPRRQAHFEIWQVGSRIVSVDHPVRRSILNLLDQKPRNLTDLARLTHKAKSTLSALHLPPLLAQGVVREARAEPDTRVKLYRLAAHRLGSSDVAIPELRDAVLNYVQSSGVLPLASALRLVDPEALVSSGAQQAYVRVVAERLGHSVARILTHRHPARATVELSRVLEGAGLGRLEGRPDEGLRLRPARAPLAPFVREVAAAALQAHLRRPVRWADAPPRPSAPVLRARANA